MIYYPSCSEYCKSFARSFNCLTKRQTEEISIVQRGNLIKTYKLIHTIDFSEVEIVIVVDSHNWKKFITILVDIKKFVNKNVDLIICVDDRKEDKYSRYALNYFNEENIYIYNNTSRAEINVLGYLKEKRLDEEIKSLTF